MRNTGQLHFFLDESDVSGAALAKETTEGCPVREATYVQLKGIYMLRLCAAMTLRTAPLSPETSGSLPLVGSSCS
ncbi:hypothetical protein [Paenibacillus prosopidis]|uniref:hypothetical protein n=1 Tax=Paenibacillus prosopidis TaxID=630520 RepID=UPI0015F17930|nr:hypothetical protein [Paenibacillus prosopidis]